MSRLWTVCGNGRQSSWLAITSILCAPMRVHVYSMNSILNAIQSERDVSVRQRAIDLLYAMCDHTNAQTIVEELLHYLEKADYSIRETLVR